MNRRVLRDHFHTEGYCTLENFLDTHSANNLLKKLKQINPSPSIPDGDKKKERDFFEVFSARGNTKLSEIDDLRNSMKLRELLSALLGKDYEYCGHILQIYLPHMSHQQSWHTDSEPNDSPFYFVNCIFNLQNQNDSLGLTRVIPRSHKKVMQKRFSDHAPLPYQRELNIPAGTLTCFNSLIWHSAKINRSEEARFVLNLRFCEKKFGKEKMGHCYNTSSRHAKGMRRFGKPIFDHPNEEGSYLWPNSYDHEELEKLLRI